MARIVNVHPGSGQVDDQITIVVEYDPAPNAPNVTHVIFENHVDAPQFNVTAQDFANRQLTLVARVPSSAVKGPIQVDIDGVPPIGTIQNFTVTRPNPQPLSVTNVMPPMPLNGYQRGSQLSIVLSRPVPNTTTVLFPRTAFGPPILRPTIPANVALNTVRVTIPAAAQTGRVKIRENAMNSALTRILNFI